MIRQALIVSFEAMDLIAKILILFLENPILFPEAIVIRIGVGEDEARSDGSECELVDEVSYANGHTDDTSGAE